jgi:hypothetical protein
VFTQVVKHFSGIGIIRIGQHFPVSIIDFGAPPCDPDNG